MAQSTTNLGKIHVFPSETLYNQFKDIIADNDLALLKDDGAYIVAANLAQNGYVKFSNGLILQWGLSDNVQSQTITFPVSFVKNCYHVTWIAISSVTNAYKASGYVNSVTKNSFYATADNISCQKYWIAIGV